LQILSIVTGAQLKRIFERRTNFDLRRLLNGKFSTGEMKKIGLNLVALL